ncbi:MAG: FtsX-like permease family protein [Oscillibacter sp.]|nr:FtsX-like permease family protein [Oscillibacter sp.]
MNFIKRAWYSLLYRKKNTLLTILMFFVLGVLVLSGLCIQSASRQSVQQIQQDVGAEIVISNVMPYYADYGVNGLTLSTVEIASGLTGVTGIEYSSEVETRHVDFDPIWTEEQSELYAENATTILVAGEGNTVAAEDFAEGTSVLSAGRHIVKSDKNVALIHATLAEHNGLDIGDSITVRSRFVEDVLEVKIIGIFTTEDAADFNMAATQQPENKIYVTAEDSFALLGREMVYQGVLTLDDPTKADEYVERIKGFFKPIEEDAVCFIRDTEYRSLAGPLSSVQGAAAVMVIAVLVLGAVILVLVTILSMHAREFEMGILLAMGERKWKIIVQLFLELLVPVLIAVTLSILPVQAMIPTVGSAVGLREAVSIGSSQVSALYGVSMLLAAVSTVVSAGKVLSCQPKKIMTAVE